MAYIELGGPGPGGNTRITRLEFPDQVMADVVEAVAAMGNYTGDDPGRHVIDQMVNYFAHIVRQHKKKPLLDQVEAAVLTQVEAVKSSVVVKVNGVKEEKK